MAIDKEKTKEFLKSIDELFDAIPVKNEALKRKIRDVVLGPALEGVRKVIDESRPPALMVIGRRGHGKWWKRERYSSRQSRMEHWRMTRFLC